VPKYSIDALDFSHFKALRTLDLTTCKQEIDSPGEMNKDFRER